MDSFIPEFGHIHSCIWGFHSKINNRVVNSVSLFLIMKYFLRSFHDQDEMARFDHEIHVHVFSMVILSHLLIQEGQLSVSGEMCTVLVNRLED